MNSATITPELVDEVLQLIEINTPFQKEWITWEVQDDFQLLFISIAVDEFPEKDIPSIFKNARHLINNLMPNRKSDYSWMVSFTEAGRVVDSYFGGNAESPNSGL